MKLKLFMSILLPSLLVSCTLKNPLIKDIENNEGVKNNSIAKKAELLRLAKEKLRLAKEDKAIDTTNADIVESFSVVSKTVANGDIAAKGLNGAPGTVKYPLYKISFPIQIKVKLKKNFTHFPHLATKLEDHTNKNNAYIYKLNSGNLISSSVSVGKAGEYIFQIDNDNKDFVNFFKKKDFMYLINTNQALTTGHHDVKKSEYYANNVYLSQIDKSNNKIITSCAESDQACWNAYNKTYIIYSL